MSDTTFSADSELTVSGTLKNTGNLRGSEVIQLYIGKQDSGLIRASKELKAFEKIFLEPGESREVTLSIDSRCFSYYNPVEKEWCIEGGDYQVQIGNSSNNILYTFTAKTTGDGKEKRLTELYKNLPVYFKLPEHGDFHITEEEFSALYLDTLPSISGRHSKYSPDSLVSDLNETESGKEYYKTLLGQLEIALGGKESSLYKLICTGIDQVPLRSLLISGVLDYKKLFYIIDQLNNKNN